MNDRHRKRKYDRQKEQTVWSGAERRRTEYKWARIITDEVKKLKYQVSILEDQVLFLHRATKPKGD